jgi:nitrogen fixation NifU-like protein
MTDLLELYQELILDHNRQPRNRGAVDEPDRSAEGFNPLCGDQVTITLRLTDGVIDEVRFDGKGCAISTASASLMSEAVNGKTIDEARALFGRFHHLLTDEPAPGGDATHPGDAPPLGKLEAFSGVRRFPVRVKCATLAWHTLVAALDDEPVVVSTE